MLLVLALTLGLAETPLAAATNEPDRCESARSLLLPVSGDEPLRMRPLSREPLGRQERAVQRSEDGCVKPVVVREDVGR